MWYLNLFVDRIIMHDNFIVAGFEMSERDLSCFVGYHVWHFH